MRDVDVDASEMITMRPTIKKKEHRSVYFAFVGLCRITQSTPDGGRKVLSPLGPPRGAKRRSGPERADAEKLIARAEPSRVIPNPKYYVEKRVYAGFFSTQRERRERIPKR
jgi:hypothetical protein